jgi:predicted nucleic acid-binding protein
LIVLDTSALYAALVDTEAHHDQARQALEQESPPFVLSPFVLCELDYLLVTGVGAATELALLADVAACAYLLAPFAEEDVAAAAGVIGRYGDLAIGLADASVVVLADRYGTDRVLTLDERHFRALRTLDGRPFTLLPADA